MKRLALLAIPAALLLFAGQAFAWTPITGSGQCDTSPGRGSTYVYIVSGDPGELYDVAVAFFNDPNTPDWADGIHGSDIGKAGTAGITTNASYIWVRVTGDPGIVTRIDASPKCEAASPSPSALHSPRPTPTHVAPRPTPPVTATELHHPVDSSPLVFALAVLWVLTALAYFAHAARRPR